jgi:hypothetical protein
VISTQFEHDLKDAIRAIPDYPSRVVFRDITTLLGNARAFRRAVDEMVPALGTARKIRDRSVGGTSGASTLCLLVSRDPVQGVKTVAWGENVLSIRKPIYKVPDCCLSDCEPEEIVHASRA